MVNWKDIHKDFAERDYRNKTYQQKWEEADLTYQDAQAWIAVGFTPYDYEIVKSWKDYGFTLQETKSWIKKGLTPKEAEFASYLKQKNYQPATTNLTSVKNQYQQSQTYLDFWYPLEETCLRKGDNLGKTRQKITRLDISKQNLQGSLKLERFINLEWLNCWDNQLTNLDCRDCDNLQALQCHLNNLSNFNFLQTLPNPEKLTRFDIRNNNITSDLSPLRKLMNLGCLWLNNNPLSGSLEPLARMIKLRELDISDTDLESGLEWLPESVWDFRCPAKEKKDAKCQAIYNLFSNDQGIVETEDGWIKNFPQKLRSHKPWVKQQWKNLGFTEEEIQQWTNAGAKLDDYKFVSWFRNTKKLGLDWIIAYQEDYQILSERFKRYGLCIECKQPNTGERWCKKCNASRLQEEFTQWTSHNPQINKFIQEYQLKATDKDKLLEWIPYEQFTDTEYLAEGGFGKVYKAKWTAGNIRHWDDENKQWYREKDHYYEEEEIKNRQGIKEKKEVKKYKNYREVVLKSLNNSQKNTNFLQEVAKHKIIDDWFNNIVSCYGISQNPNTKEYLMIMQYMPEGNLRHYLKNKNKKLTLKDKLNYLAKISQGLKDIHQKDLVHRDFHSGNILKGIEKTSCLITDLGLCKPVNEASRENKIFGVMPYVAPEVLQQKPYAQASDIYSFGIIAYEVLSGLPPYHERAHDVSLGIDICKGLRPKFNIQIPPLLKNLIERCWNADPAKRLTASELERTLRGWEQEINPNDFVFDDYTLLREKEQTQFKNQFQTAEEFNQTLPEEIKFPKYEIHEGAAYHSKLLPTKEITKLLQTSQLINEESKYDSAYITGEYDADVTREEENNQTNDLVAQTKRQLSLESQAKSVQREAKFLKTKEQLIYQTEPMEIDEIEVNQQTLQTPLAVSAWRKLTRGSFKSYLRQNAKKDWFDGSKLKFSNDSLKNLIILPDQSEWLHNTEIIDENQIQKWSQQVYQKIDLHWCLCCQRVCYCDGENYFDYCIDHICEEENCQNEAKQNEQGKNLCTEHFKQQESRMQEQSDAQIIQLSGGGYYD